MGVRRREDMGSFKITFDYNNAMADVVGDRHGIRDKEIKALEKQALEVH